MMEKRPGYDLQSGSGNGEDARPAQNHSGLFYLVVFASDASRRPAEVFGEVLLFF
jgi:hypothetical protein